VTDAVTRREEVALAMLGVLANAEHSFFDLCIEVGQQVFSALMEQDRERLCGPKGKHDPDRDASRAGSTASEITFGGRMSLDAAGASGGARAGRPRHSRMRRAIAGSSIAAIRRSVAPQCGQRRASMLKTRWSSAAHLSRRGRGLGC